MGENQCHDCSSKRSATVVTEPQRMNRRNEEEPTESPIKATRKRRKFAKSISKRGKNISAEEKKKKKKKEEKRREEKKKTKASTGTQKEAVSHPETKRKIKYSKVNDGQPWSLKTGGRRQKQY